MYTISMSELACLVHACMNCGIDVQLLLERIGVATSDNTDPDRYWDADVIARMYDEGIALSTAGHFPFLMGENYVFQRTPEADAFLATSSTLREALDLLFHIPLLLQPELLITYDEEGASVRLRVEFLAKEKPFDCPGVIETVMVILARTIENLLRHPPRFGLSFQHQPLTTPDSYHQCFGTAPRFGATDNVLSFPASYMDKPLPSAAPGLHAVAQLQIDNRLKRLQAKSGIEQTVNQILTQSPGLSIAEVSEIVGLDTRSLQRRLKGANTSFADLQRRTRNNLAKRMLLYTTLDMDSISIKLGFSDRNSFTKAFSKWNEIAPSQFRKEAFQ